MLKIKNKDYSGYVTEGDDEITTIISSVNMLQDIIGDMSDVKEVTVTEKNGLETTYAVTRPISATVVSKNIYAIRFSTKPSATQVLEDKNQELSDAIDDILVMMLEG